MNIQFRTAVKSSAVDGTDRNRNRDIPHSYTVLKSFHVNALHRIGNIHCFQIFAVGKGIAGDLSHVATDAHIL